jgi:hypothetical protein
MSHKTKDLKPLFLSAEEAMGLLDLCMLSQTDLDRDREGILLKLSDLVRQHLAAHAAEAAEIGVSDATEPPGELPDCLATGDGGRLAVSGAEFITTRTNSVRPAALKPCPAGRFRSWIATTGI